MTRRRPVLRILLRLALLLGVALAAMPAVPRTQVAHAQTNVLKLSVVSARTEPRFPDDAPNAPGITKGDVVSNYQFIINRDDTGDPSQPTTPGCSPATDADYPANCEWPSIHTMPGGSSAVSEIVTQGDQGDVD